MSKPWLVAKHEYLTQVIRRSFLLGTLGIPLLIVAVMGFSIFIAVGEEDARPLGYVDPGGTVVAEPARAASAATVAIQPFPDRESAQAALDQGAIQAFYLLDAGYRQSGGIELFYLESAPDGRVRGDFNAFLRANLLAGQPDTVRQRLSRGTELTVRAADGSREFQEDDIAEILLPFLAGFFFVFAVLASSGYLLQAVTTEKENRTVEIMATSLSPGQLIGGKAVGLLAVTLTQIAIWAATAVLGIVVAARFIPELQGLSTPWTMLLVALLYFIPAYALMAGLMIAIGSMVTELREGQQVSGILNMLFILPFFFTVLIFTNPDSPLLVALTLFPTTSFITVMMRWSATAIPAWQLALSWLLLAGTAAVSVRMAARVFRVGMLRYGQPLTLRGTVSLLRGSR